jgi:hypothetical protein
VLVGGAALCVALAVCLEVAEIADVAFAVFWGAVSLAVGVDCDENSQYETSGREAEAVSEHRKE